MDRNKAEVPPQVAPALGDAFESSGSPLIEDPPKRAALRASSQSPSEELEHGLDVPLSRLC